MITFITGIPGAGKTLNTIKRVLDENKDTERPIYYRGIQDLQLPWVEISAEECHKWFDYPEGSIFVIDECQQVWPNRSNNKPVPESVARLDTHRHRGYDFYIITQKPTMVDFGVRGFAGRHYHYERGFGREGTRQLEFQRAVDDTQDYHTRQEAQVTRVKFDKSIYKLYKSAEIHTVKPRIPKQAYYFAAAILGTVALGAYAYDSIMGRTEQDDARAIVSDQFTPDQYRPITTGQHRKTRNSDEIMTVQDFADHWTPRIPDLPHSAPAYDQLLEVKTFPRPQCVRHERSGRCRCFTQQATPLDISPEHCSRMVDNGWFNPYREENQIERRGKGGGQANAPAPTASLPDTTRDINYWTDTDTPMGRDDTPYVPASATYHPIQPSF